jgi:glyoxylate reductase
MKKINFGINQKVFITGDIPEIAINILEKKNYVVKIYKGKKYLSQSELIKNVRNADAVISLLTNKFNAEVIDEIKKCKVISNYAVGFNNIDVGYAKQKNIVVTNTPDVLTDATADLAITLALACSRRVTEGERIVRSKKFKGWKPKLLLGIELKNKNFGILGAGRIGTATALRAKAFGSKIIYYSRSRKLELEEKTNAKKVSLNKLLSDSDFISIHLPLNSETYHLLNKQKLNLLKKSSIIINTARGEIIDEKALIQVLKSKKIFAAGLDVYENEPDVNSELLKLNNAILLPHIGSATEDTRNAMAELAAKNVVNVLEGKKPITPV